jgi:hypothetical protein
MDGLASTVGLLTAVMMAVIAAALGHPHVAVIAVVLAGALAGFLVHNLPPAKIFLGDSGSMVIGLIVGVLGIQGAMKTSATVAVTVPVVLMSLPILDSVLAIVRRKLTGRRFDTADREHIHHRLLDRGLSQWQALGLIGGLSLATGAAATAATVLRSDSLAWITVAVVFVGAVRLRLFGHHEVALAKGAVARRMAGWACQLAVPNSRSRIPSAARLERLPFDQSWPALVGLLRAWDVCRIELTLVAEGQYQRRQRWAAPAADLQPAERWSIAISCRQGDGRLCELRATGNQPLEPESACSAGLTRVLQVFAVHFSEHAEQIPGIGLAPVPSGPETSLETTSRTKAA